MTRQDLVKKIAAETELSQKQVGTVVDAFTETVKDCYKNNERLDLKLFGSFIPKVRKARKARNIRSGVEIEVPERKVLTFKPSTHIND